MSRSLLFCAPFAAFLLSGCIASTAASIVTAPVKVGAKVGAGAVDLATTSQAEADRNRGRAMRKRDEKIARLEKRYNRRLAACNRGETAACAEANQLSGEITQLRTER